MKRYYTLLAAVALVVFIGTEAQARHETGVQLFEDKEYEQAFRFFEDALGQNPQDPLANYYLGRIAYAGGDYNEAIDRFKVAVREQKTNSDYHLWLGRAYLEKLQTASFFAKGNLAGKVRSSYEKAVKLDPENIDARLALGNYYLNAPAIAGGSKKKARAQAAEILARDPENGRLFLAAIHVHDENYEEAVREYESYLKDNPEDTETLSDLGMLYQKMGRFADATAAFERVVELDPDYAAAWYQIGRTAVLSESGLDRGITAMQHYIDHFGEVENSFRPGSRWRLGMLLELKGESSAAQGYYEEALRLDPDFEQARESLDRLNAEELADSNRE